MKKPTILPIWGILCTVLILAACQKEVNQYVQEPPANKSSGLKGTGVIPDDPAKISKVPTIVSQDFLKQRQYQSALDMSVASRGKPTKPGTDVTPPSVAITSPSNGSVVSGATTIQVSASDNVGVSSVAVTVDGSSIGTKTTAPYNFSWTADGNSHTVTATAKDAAGNSSSNSISISKNTVTADNTAPSVSITSPANGASVTGTVNVSVNASDNIGVSAVSLSIDGTLIGTSSTSPYNFSWDASSVADGTHTLTAKASDAAGNSSTQNILVAKNTTVTTLPPTTLPSAFSLTMPPVQNQGGKGSCSAFATTYAARSVDQFYKTNASAYSLATNVLSPEFVYDQLVLGDCGAGTGVTTSLDFLMTNGTCTWQSAPYSSVNGCSITPTSAQLNEAANFKIASYSKIVVSDITAIKNMVVNKHAVIITIALDQSFLDAQAGFIWKSYSGNPGISHALVICGYDDSRHAYKVMSSWGTTWGDAGFSWIDYDFLPQAAFYYCYVIN
jgi:C1A family cysteine protease